MQQVPHTPPTKKKKTTPPQLCFQVFTEQDEDMFTLIGTIKQPLNYVSSDLEYQMSNYNRMKTRPQHTQHGKFSQMQ